MDQLLKSKGTVYVVNNDSAEKKELRRGKSITAIAGEASYNRNSLNLNQQGNRSSSPLSARGTRSPLARAATVSLAVNAFKSKLNKAPNSPDVGSPITSGSNTPKDLVRGDATSSNKKNNFAPQEEMKNNTTGKAAFDRTVSEEVSVSKMFPSVDGESGGVSPTTGRSPMRPVARPFGRSLTETNANSTPTPKFSRFPSMTRRSIRAGNNKKGEETTRISANDLILRRYIPYTVVKAHGTIAKETSDEDAQGKVLPEGTKVFVMGRKVMSCHIMYDVILSYLLL